ncbi:MAG: T9SS type A sorting domain-containing protein [Saprospiraceae bacterium]|nr:T9SS type A sorting domain-containing protein [Saprospiraceae bacterium]
MKIYTNLLIYSYFTKLILITLICSQTLLKANSPQGTYNLIPRLVNDIDCFGATGVIGVIVQVTSGTVAGIQYSWSGGTQQISGPDLRVVTAGTYTVTVTSTNSNSKTLTISITEPAKLTNSAQITDVDCFSLNNGKIIITSSGGTGGYKYAWNTGANTKDLLNIKAGIYRVSVTDSKNCFSLLVSSVKEPSQLLNSGLVTDANCFGNSTGKIVNTTTGGNGGYKYSWSNGSTSKDLMNEKAGTYNLTVSDSKNCETSPKVQSFTIKQPDQLSVTSVLSPVKCFGGSDGKIECTAKGGNGNYTFKWNNGANTNTISQLKAGLYKLILTDSKNCKNNPEVQEFEIVQPGKISNSGFTTKEVDCFGFKTGEIIQRIEGGTKPYSYLWNDNKTTENRTNIGIGQYSCQLTDANKCTENFTYTILGPPELHQSASKINPETINGKGSIEIVVSGGTFPYNFDWTGPNGFKSGTKDITGLSKGDYVLIVTDANNCVIQKTYTVPFLNAVQTIDDKNIEVLVHNNKLIIKNLATDVSGTINIYDSNGSLVNTFNTISTTDKSEFQLNNMISGLYLIKISCMDKFLIRKVFVK